MQGLLETHMNMPVAAMQSFAQLSPDERGMQVLPGACLPARGFYRIRTVTPGQLQKPQKRGSLLCGMSWWSCCDSEEPDQTAKQTDERHRALSEEVLPQAGKVDFAETLEQQSQSHQLAETAPVDLQV